MGVADSLTWPTRLPITLPLLLRHTNHLKYEPHTVLVTFNVEVAMNPVFLFYFLLSF
jgi:hypothetical protein